MSTAEQNKATVTRFDKQFIDGGDINAFNEIIAPEFLNHTAPAGVPKGPEGVMYFFNHFLKPAFPELKIEIQRQVAENDMVTTHKVFHAVHKGDFMGIPATGKKCNHGSNRHHSPEGWKIYRALECVGLAECDWSVNIIKSSFTCRRQNIGLT